MDIDTIPQPYSDFTSFTGIPCCVSVQLYHTCSLVWPSPQSRYRRVPSQGSLRLPFRSHGHLFPSPPSSLATVNLLPVSVIFFMWKILYKWSHSVCTLMGLELCSQHDSFEIHLRHSYTHWRCRTLKDIWAVSSFALLWIKPLWTFPQPLLWWLRVKGN